MEQIPFSLKRFSGQKLCGKEAWRTPPDQVKQSLWPGINPGSEMLPAVDLRIWGLGTMQLNLSIATALAETVFSPHTDRESSQVKFYGPFS